MTFCCGAHLFGPLYVLVVGGCHPSALRKIINGVIPTQFGGRPMIVLSPCMAVRIASISCPPDQIAIFGGSPPSGHASRIYRTFQSPEIVPPYLSVKSLTEIVRFSGRREDHAAASFVKK